MNRSPLIRLPDFLAACRRRRRIDLCLLCVLVATGIACWIAWGISARREQFKPNDWGLLALYVLPMLIGASLKYWVYWRISSSDPRLRCPHCAKTIGDEYVHIAVASRKCVHCETQIIAECANESMTTRTSPEFRAGYAAMHRRYFELVVLTIIVAVVCFVIQWLFRTVIISSLVDGGVGDVFAEALLQAAVLVPPFFVGFLGFFAARRTALRDSRICCSDCGSILEGMTNCGTCGQRALEQSGEN